MVNSLRILVKQGLCSHKRALFLGSIIDARVPSKELYLYSCSRCMKLFSSTEPLEYLKDVSFSIDKDGSFTFSHVSSHVTYNYDLSRFIEELKQGKFKFSRIDLEHLLKNTEEELKERIRKNNALNFALKNVRAENVLLQSILDNSDNIILSEETTKVFLEHSSQLDSSLLLNILHKELLSEKQVFVPIRLYKLFHLMLSTLYGYEPMRYRWEWEKKEISGEVYYIFFNRKTRRTK